MQHMLLPPILFCGTVMGALHNAEVSNHMSQYCIHNITENINV